MIQVIKEIFADKIGSSAKLNATIKKYPEIKQWCEKYLITHPEFQKVSYLIITIVKNIQLPKCKYCGKSLKYSSLKTKNKYCSYECTYADNDWKQNLGKYQVTTQTLEKRKKTCLEKYGVENVSQSDLIKQKKCETTLKHFGTNFPMQSKDVLEKSKQTLKTHFNVEYISQAPQIKTKKWLKRAKLNYKNLQKYSAFVIPNFSLDEYIKNGLNNQQWKCTKCGNIFVQKYQYTTRHIQQLSCCPRCLNCYPINSSISKMETQLVDFCKSLNLNILTNNRSILENKQELDIVIPQKKIAIQFNGTYWHSSQHKDKNYHLNKTLECEKAGYRLIHIFQYDWLQKKDIIKAKLKAILGIDQVPIYARKCQIKQITTKQKNQFLNSHHIQGQDKSKIKLGLFYENQLFAVMTFGKPRFNKNYEYELIRYASKSGFRVIGGAGKLLKYFERNYKPKSIITYADRSYSQGNMYKQLGFNLLNISEPNFIWVNDDLILSRYQCTKNALKKFLRHFDSSLSCQENLINHNFNRIYDCGNFVFNKNFY